MIMETSEKDSRRSEKHTPIIDGDARPDINLHPEETKNQDHPIPIPGDRGRKKTTKNRNDINSLEDFRDGKQE
jgi:hypothetical protein